MKFKSPELLAAIVVGIIASVVFVFIYQKIDMTVPETVTKAFLEELNDYNYQGAKSYSTAETDLVLDVLSNMTGGAARPKRNWDIRQIVCDVDGDNAICSACCNPEGWDGEVRLIKVNGEWQVTMTKEEMTKDE